MDLKHNDINLKKFNNEAYEALVKDLINDAFYIENRSNRGTISTIRQYAEVIVRRILNLSNEDYVTLGNKNILDQLKKQSKNNPLLLDALRNITEKGNKCTHSQAIGAITEEDVDSVINSLFELYAYLLVDYFEKYKFGLNMEIVSSFSILPPIIRYITLKYLNCKYPDNITIIDKFSLAILKAFDKEKAINWIEERKEILSITPSMSKQAEKDCEEKMGKEISRLIIDSAPNMYDLCNKRINTVGCALNQNGKLYNDFESAIELYYEKGIVQGETPDVLEFNSIMEFLYLGRKARINELLKEKDSYLFIDNIFLEF
ncbi:hypothetical protein [Clostridium perfringens]|uniref:hypothetical protein n=1 Tax=Clostridium perfringens TaxID=1502 RepID=UPI0039E73964